MATPKIDPGLWVKNLRWTTVVTEEAVNRACAQDRSYQNHLREYHERLEPAVQPTPLQVAEYERRRLKKLYYQAVYRKKMLANTKRRKLKDILENLRARKREIFRELLAKEVARVRQMARIGHG